MKLNHIACLCACLAGSLAGMAQTTTRLTATKANDYGLVYSLPQTIVDVTLRATCTVSKPGEFYNYAERYLGADAARKAVAKASTRWELTGVDVTTRGEIPADAEQWLMQFKGGQPVFVELDSRGIPLAISTEAPEREAPAALPEPTPLTASPLDNEAARYAVTEDMLQSASMAKRAQLAANAIMQLRQSRQDYLTGQAETMPDGKALDLILANINAQEEALTAMFLGTVQTRTAATRVSYIPGGSDEADRVIARLSPVKGFVDPDDLSGAPVSLQFAVTSRGLLPKTDKGEEKKFPKGGVAYCIPGSATIAIEYDGKTWPRTRVNVAQLGIVFGLDPSFFTNKKEPGSAIFDPTTGGILQLATTPAER